MAPPAREPGGFDLGGPARSRPWLLPAIAAAALTAALSNGNGGGGGNAASGPVRTR